MDGKFASYWSFPQQWHWLHMTIIYIIFRVGSNNRTSPQIKKSMLCHLIPNYHLRILIVQDDPLFVDQAWKKFHHLQLQEQVVLRLNHVPKLFHLHDPFLNLKKKTPSRFSNKKKVQTSIKIKFPTTVSTQYPFSISVKKSTTFRKFMALWT